MVGRVVFGPLVEPAGHDSHGHEADHKQGLPRDLTAREIGVLLPLAAGCLILGVYPKPLLKSLEPGIRQIVQTADAARGERAAPLAGMAPRGDATEGAP